MRYKDENLVDEYLLSALEEINGNNLLQSVLNRLLVIDELHTHTANVAKLGVQLAMDLGLPDNMVRKICLAGVLHDTMHDPDCRRYLFGPGGAAPVPPGTDHGGGLRVHRRLQRPGPGAGRPAERIGQDLRRKQGEPGRIVPGSLFVIKNIDLCVYLWYDMCDYCCTPRYRMRGP